MRRKTRNNNTNKNKGNGPLTQEQINAAYKNVKNKGETYPNIVNPMYRVYGPTTKKPNGTVHV